MLKEKCRKTRGLKLSESLIRVLQKKKKKGGVGAFFALHDKVL